MRTIAYTVTQDPDEDFYYVMVGDRAGPRGEWGPFKREETAELVADHLEAHGIPPSFFPCTCECGCERDAVLYPDGRCVSCLSGLAPAHLAELGVTA